MFQWKIRLLAKENVRGEISIMKTNKKFTELTCFKLCFQSAPILTMLTIINTILLCIIPAINIFATAKFINSAVELVTKSKSLTTVIFPICLVVALTGYTYLERNISAIIWLKISLRLKKDYGLMQIKKIASMKYEHIENKEDMELIKRVAANEVNIYESYRNILGAIAILCNILSVFITIMTASFVTAVLVLVITIPLIFVAMKAGKVRYDNECDVTNYKRQYEYGNELYSNRASADERYLFQYSPLIEKKWRANYEEYRKRSVRTTIKSNMHLEGSSVITSLLTIIIASLILFSYYRHEMTIGLFLSIFAAVMSLIETMSWSFTNTITNLTNYHQYLKDVDKFFKMSEEDGALENCDANHKTIKTIELKNVKFRYPGTQTYILNGLSLKMEANKHYAFVGSNGAGKTTVVKLLTGLYRDYEGKILINGKELRQYELRELKSIFSNVYQDFAKYEVPIRENIWLGKTDATKQEIEASIRAAGLEKVISKLKYGLDTPLGKTFENGVDLSGGEWQRVAIARSLLRKDSIQILDEPTAALDPIMENKLYQEFANVSKAHTSIFISHRLGSTKLADIIFVLNEGKLAEYGTHESLMQNNYIYKNMYESQRKWYE